MTTTSEANMNEEPLKLLIADDDTPTRLLLRAAITQWGYEIIEAKDGQEAWDILQGENPPRLLILDWVMPKLDGITLCERCKKELKYQPYIILLTQVGGTSNLIKGLEAGADEFLTKPFNMPELKSRLSIGARIIKYNIALSKQSKLQSITDMVLSLLKESQATLKKDSISLNEKVKIVEENINKIIQQITYSNGDKE